MGEPWEVGFYGTLGDRVRRRRRELGLSQADVAQKLKLTRASITNLEAGRQRPLAHQVAVLAQVLAMDVGQLLPHPDIPQRDADAVLHEDMAQRVRAAARKM